MRFEELTRDELNELAPRSTVVVPVASTEQHGPHLPVCTDAVIVTALAERVVARGRDAGLPLLVAPTLPFGFSHYHRSFGGTISVGLQLLGELLAAIGESLALAGFRRIVFLNGHGGNDASVQAVGDRLVHERGLQVQVAAISYWVGVDDLLPDTVLGAGPFPGHAGGFETSCMLALRPDLVRLDRRPAPEAQVRALGERGPRNVVVRSPGIWEDSDGRTDDASRASAEVGEAALAVIVQNLLSSLEALHRSTS